MDYRIKIYRAFLLLTVLFMMASGLSAQKLKSKKTTAEALPSGQAVMWEKVNIADRDLYDGPGGKAMQPDLSKITFVADDKKNNKRGKKSANIKYKIKDGSGQAWTAKLDTRHEARSEAAAVRLLYGLGYKTEVNYLVPSLTIPGKGTFTNVRLKGHLDGVKTLDDPWKWRDNPFVGTNELQGLKIMMIFMTNWDLVDVANDIVKDKNSGELQYVVGDIDATFGRFGNNNLPLFYRFGRKSSSPRDWSKAKFITGVKDGRIKFATTGAKYRGLFKDITVQQGRWLADLLLQLDDRQIEDAFRAANFSPADVDILTKATKRRIAELDRAAAETNLAGR